MKTNKYLIILAVIFIFSNTLNLSAEEKKPEHLLDGTSMEYFYQNGSGISIEFYDGKLQFDWIAGPAKGNKGKDIPYMSRKIGDEMYIVNFHQKQKHNFITLIFNFNQNVMYGSYILGYGMDKEKIGFEGGIIEHVKR